MGSHWLILDTANVIYCKVSGTTHYYSRLNVLTNVSLQGSVCFSRNKRAVSQEHDSANKWITARLVDEEVNNDFKPPETSALCSGLKHVVRTGSSVTHPLDNLGSALAPLQKLYEVTQFQSNQTKRPGTRRSEEGSSVSSGSDAAATSRGDGLHPSIRALAPTSCDVTRHSTSFICGENTLGGGEEGGSFFSP